jgi:hypothetical protein
MEHTLRTRHSGRSHQEISNAQHHIRQNCLNLITGKYSRNNNFGPQSYFQFSNVPHSPPAFNFASQPFIVVPSERSCRTTPMSRPCTTIYNTQTIKQLTQNWFFTGKSTITTTISTCKTCNNVLKPAKYTNLQKPRTDDKHHAQHRASTTRQTTQQQGCIPLQHPEVAINNIPHWIQEYMWVSPYSTRHRSFMQQSK